MSSCFKLIEAEKASYPVSVLCRVLKVSRSGYYDWKDRPPSKRERENAALMEKIREVHDRSRRIYGYPRVHAELRALGVRCSRKRVARLMSKAGLQGCIRSPRKRTTRRDLYATPAPDLSEEELRCSSTRQDLDGGHNLHLYLGGFFYLGGFSLPGLHPRRLLSASSRLVDGNSPAYRACGRCS